ncbi:hypothetical protein R51_37620 [Bacillus safensis]|nr:hypothetical protein R51_37620 [Bacillus safensis]
MQSYSTYKAFRVQLDSTRYPTAVRFTRAFIQLQAAKNLGIFDIFVFFLTTF